MNELVYKQAAKTWTEAIPLGNGRMGAMQFGGVETERFQLNEDTLWSGPPTKNKTYDDKESLEKVRQLIDEEKYEDAISETKNMFGPYTQAYMPLGNLHINFLHGNMARNYRRRLNVEEAIASVDYSVGEVEFSREAFISHPHEVLVVQLTSSEKNMLNVDITLDSLLKSKNVESDLEQLALQGICPEFCAPNYYEGEHTLPIIYGEFEETNAIHFEGRLGVKLEDGQMVSSNGKLSIKNATKAVIYFSAKTSFNGFDQLPGRNFSDLTKQNEQVLKVAMEMPYDELKGEHIRDYQQLYHRVDFQLEKESVDVTLDTDERIRQYGSKDLGIIELLFQYGRYLLLSSSREGSQPANLQGIWNELTRAPWSSNYTLNINAEMNYWPAESTNLAECHQPLLQAIKELSVTGEQMVSERYGLNGWTAHHNSDIWRHAHPVGGKRHGDPIWAFWPMSGPWLTRHLWEHYTHSQDEQYLQEVFPIMKGAAAFCLDWLIEDENGYLITSPSTSPEHLFVADDGQVGSVTKAATMDLQIIWDLFTNLIEAGAVLDIDDEFLEKVKAAKERLHPLQIGKYGQLQEWLKDYQDREPHHRHVSHLYGLYPGYQITEGPLLDASKQTLNRRGDAGTGWSLGWKICLWSRLKDGERISALLEQLFTIVEETGEVMKGGGLYPNLLGAHPPFQIDGNFSYTAGVVEMIVQSHQGFVEVLPALPSNWIAGSLSGIRVRGGFELGIKWDKRQVTELTVLSKSSNKDFVLKTNNPIMVSKSGEEEVRLEPVDGIITISINPNEQCTLVFEQ